ncbi:glycosyltransferase family 4 protein [Cohnella caldifontis]|uniref:glycosyltransferase family 4 protein n=1 Tax=Cohnella caldifontis TaxID=3027471 RepID=UPI0023EDB8B8|nr:glycosyltransferase family 4 protein [Cohnella sp. YIM B05605]
MKPVYHVVWKGPVRRLSGLGIASREYVKALRSQGVQTTVGAARSRTGGEGRRVLVYHHLPNTLRPRKERKRFHTILVNTVWETTRIPRSWVKPINASDAVCVPTVHNRRALRRSGVRVPVFLVPHGVHARDFRPVRKRHPSRKSKRRFTFLSVFGFQHRKNPEGLLKAYWAEFSDEDNVELIIKTNGYSPRENGRWIRGRIRAYKSRLNLRKRTAPVRIIAGHLSRAKLRRLYGRAHAFVLPTRGEGVGLPFLESMASGVPVIATGWGGHMDFVNRKNGFLVRYRLRPPAIGMNRRSAISRPFRRLFAQKGQLWAEPDLRSLRSQMRRAYRNPVLCRRKGRLARRDALRYSWDRAGRALKHAIETTIRRKR